MATESTKLVCPQCWGELTEGQIKCWLCGQDLTTELGAPVVTTESAASAPDKFSFSLGTTMLLLTLASVIFGIVAISPGLGFWVCILAVPVLVRTIRNVRESEARGQKVSPAQKVGLFASSFAAAMVIAVLVCAAAFATFCGVCLLLVSTDSRHGGTEYLIWGLGMCAFGGLSIFALIRHFRKKRAEKG